MHYLPASREYEQEADSHLAEQTETSPVKCECLQHSSDSLLGALSEDPEPQ